MKTRISCPSLCLVFTSILFQNPVSVQGIVPLQVEFPLGYVVEDFRIKKITVPPKFRKDVGSFRLPKHVLPIHYNLEIMPILEDVEGMIKYTAPGKVSIHIKCDNVTSSVTVHSKNLTIKNDGIQIEPLTNGTSPLVVTGYNMDTVRSFHTFFFSHDLEERGEYLLTIPFIAVISSDRMAGIYQTSYKGSDGSKKTAVVTQFQKDEASRAFPCFDEPSMKATFSIKVGRLSSEYQTFSNAEQVGEPEPIPDLPNWVWDIYAKTPILATYTIAFAVTSEFVAEDSPEYKYPIKTWVPKTAMTDTNVKFAAEASTRIMKFYEELFDIPYQMKKLYNLGVPEMHLYGMEHPGLVTYRTRFMVWQSDENTQFEKYQSASLIAHEFSHMYFGNMLTCAWWNDFWLNEGFARYFQFIGAQIAGPDNFRSTDRWTIDVTQWAMEFDEGPDSVPVHAQETDRVFYQPFHIEYEKGAALIRMMQSFLTQKTFIGALQRYMKRHMNKNVVQDDLFNAMTEQGREDGVLADLDVRDIMKSWTTQTGFPILRVMRGDSHRIFITQQRFVLHPTYMNRMSDPSMLWYIPVWYITQSNSSFDGENTIPNLWMDNNTLTAYVAVENTSEWIIVNPEARGYYRVVYDSYLTSLIGKQLETDHTVFSFLTRSQLIDDYWRSTLARYIGIGQVLSLTRYLTQEDDHIVWTTVFNNFRKFYNRIIDTPIISPLKQHIRLLIKPPLQRLGYKIPANSSASDVMLHSMMLDWACSLEDTKCIKLAQEYLQSWISNPDEPNPIPTDIQPQIYCTAVSYSSNNSVQTFLRNHYKVTNSTRQKNLVVRALTCDRDPDALTELFQSAIDPNYAEINMTQYGATLLFNIVRNHVGRKIVWNIIKNKQEEITSLFGSNVISNVIASVSPYASNMGLSDLNYEIMAFIATYLNTPGLPEEVTNSLQSSAQRIVDNSVWMDYFYHELENWLSK